MSKPKSHNKFGLENAIPTFYVESSYVFFLPHQKSPIILSIYLQVVSGNPIVDIVWFGTSDNESDQALAV